jgi:hypothetical protein
MCYSENIAHLNVLLVIDQKIHHSQRKALQSTMSLSFILGEDHIHIVFYWVKQIF